ncbi:hemolysin family protein [Bacillus cereus]|uniref:hemolysin family protein n=1 Tax=Bacillus cereus group TaxID=86661 RepID=UPI0024053680|nr:MULTISPECIES: hemolysin family protein [Bacillus cereus group]MDF9507843.1 hemolysin family protein [Bacillus cereus]MDF9594616.1 hemolysin family protein [Bacillus cereus]MDF9606522.1 hemolysin family protein [Bacillus cereus]MDF9657462.1 hemolysin family protein [Bacillus cereus]MEB4818070.1 hemolysin family protein [Bacillus thuringiensis]
MDITVITNLILIVILIALTAFFVGSEFAVVKVRMTRIDQLVLEGNKRALAVKKIVDDLDYYLSACQLGITVTALGLGTLGEPTVERMLHPLFDDIGISGTVSTLISYILALSIMTFLHVVVGELAPKTLAIQYAERLTLLFGPSLVIFGKLLFPLIWLLNGSARIILRMFNIQPANHEQAHSEEELKIIMNQSYQSGEINETELSLMQNIFSFDQRVAKDIMVPRTQLVVLDNAMDNKEILNIIDEYHFTRYPVTTEGDKDDIIGVVNAKEMVTNIALGRPTVLKDYIHEIPFVHEASSLQDALLKMQKEHVHIALVIDEFGGTAGIISLEDILEEIVGEIRDEFDEDEVADIFEKSECEYIINGRVLLSDLESRFDLKFDNQSNVDTIGGWMQVQYLLSEEIKEPIVDGNYRWEIIEMDHHQILQVSLELLKDKKIDV